MCHPKRILVVHHERLIGELICKLLQQDGYETRIESSSVDAIRAARQFAPRLLIIDPVMPQISGRDAAKRIFGQTSCKVLVVSVGASDSRFGEIVDDLRGEGCDCAALGLPFEKDDLLELVRIRMGSETAVPSGMGLLGREAQGADSSESMIDFANMTPVMPDTELMEGFVRVIMPNGKCFDILEELWTKARQIEPGCVIMSLKATGKKQN
jgi:two-component system OmpR family response regulator